MPESKYPKQQDGNTEKHAHSRRRRDIHQKNKLNEFRFKEINLQKHKKQPSSNFASRWKQFIQGLPFANQNRSKKTDTNVDSDSTKKQTYFVKEKSMNPSESGLQLKRRQNESTKKANPYQISNLDSKERTLFSLNVFLNVIGKLLIYLLAILILGGSVGLGAGVGYFARLVSQTPPPSQEQMLEDINRLEQQSTIYYANGTPIANVQSDLVRSLTQLDEISPEIKDGIIATEDEYFYEHPGIVPKAILRAAIETLFKGSGTGGSTITQQLVKQQMLSNDVTFFRKANEILLALRLENNFSKDDILTAYLNVSPFGRNNKGENIAGIAKAAEGIFGRSTEEVNLNQAAFLVGLPQDPYAYTPYNQDGSLRSDEELQRGLDRMKTVLYRMYRAQKLSKEEYEQALTYDIRKDFIQPEAKREDRQSYLYQAMAHGAIEKLMHINILDDGYTLDQVYSDDEWYNEYYFKAEEQLRTGGYRIYTTIDKEIYDQLQQSAQAYEDELGVPYEGVYVNPDTGEETYYVERVQTGLVVIENQTGKVLGFISGTNYEDNQIDHAFRVRRSPGSTIKPLAVYGPAVDNDIINPSTIVPDTPFVQTFEDGSTWEPTNYGTAVSNTFMTVRKALLRSDNLPAVRVYQESLRQGVPVIDYLKKMGFNPVDSYTAEDTENLAFALGGVTTGPTVFEETRAFTTFANNGNYVDGYYIERIEDAFGNTVFQQDAEPVPVFAEDSNYLMVDMLRDTMTEGTGRTANQYKEVPGDWIAKTGISENSKDIWVLASTPALTVGSWIGYDSRYAEYTIDVNDGYGLESVRSQIYWARIVNDLYALRPDIFGTDLTFKQPDSVMQTNIVETTGTLPGTTEFNGMRFSVSQPLVQEIFKTSNPAPRLTYNFMIGANDEELAQFWSNLRTQYYQQQNSNNNQSTESQESTDESNESSQDETASSSEETILDTENQE
ncbi:transglycosylase domain-containing protein [Ignavigranum ruoffiae]|uniref:transglycosylase domain-containing protein n=1 Tax=Ignavigranum ruoffiae TaxID=89093 RepID=UPI003B005C6C